MLCATILASFLCDNFPEDLALLKVYVVVIAPSMVGNIRATIEEKTIWTVDLMDAKVHFYCHKIIPPHNVSVAAVAQLVGRGTRKQH